MKRSPYKAKTNPGADGLKVLSGLPFSISVGVKQGEPLPSRLKVLGWGENRTVDGDILRVNTTTCEVLPETQKARNWPHAHIDVEHATVPGTTLFKIAAQNGKFAAILGWGNPLVIPGEGLFLDNILWTPESKRAYEFPDVSGVVTSLADGTVTGLHSLAFCCHGKAEGATAFSGLLEETQTEESMDKLLMALLGLTATATESEQLDRATKVGVALQALMSGGVDGMKAMSALLKMDTAKLTALSALDADKLTALSALSATDLTAKLKLLSSMDEGQGAAMTALGKRLGDVELQLKPLAQDLTSIRRAKILSDAAGKGKQVPATWVEKYGSDLKLLSDLVDGLPEGVVSLSQGADAGGQPPTVSAKSSAAEAEVAKAFGRKAEDLKGM